MRNKLLLLATVLVLIVAVVGLVACNNDGEKTYTYGDWTISVAPTDTATGTAVRVSSDGGEDQTFTLPVLTDPKYTIVAPTCDEAGSATITANEIGTLTISLPATGHSYAFDSFVWADDFTAQAKYVCAADATHVMLYTAVVTSEVTTPATYEADGVRTYTATYLGNTGTTTEAIAKLEHEYTFDSFVWGDDFTAQAKLVDATDGSSILVAAEVEDEITTPATCTADGVRTYTATYLGNTDVRTAVIESDGHDLVFIPAKDATCTAVGNVAYYSCADCNKKFSDEDGTQEIELADTVLAIDADAHKWVFDSFVWGDDYTAQAKFVCAHNDEHESLVAAEVEDEITTPATCTAEGVRTYTATYENHTGTTTASVEVDADAHKWVFDGFVWGDDYTAQAKFVCEYDDEHVSLVAAEVEDEITTPATCTEDGVRTYTATYENYTGTKTASIAAEGHNLDAVAAKAATCTEEGNIAYWVCLECGKYFTDEDGTQEIELADTVLAIDADAHGWVFDSFVWGDDYTAQVKLVCEYNEEHVSFVDADMDSEITTPATCTEDGVRTYTATYGDNEDTMEQVIPAAHDFQYVEMVWDGLYAQGRYVCSACEESELRDAQVSGPEVVTPATYNEAGQQSYTAVCGDDVDTHLVTIPKLVAPYDNKSYAAIVRVRGDGDYKVISSGDLYTTAGSVTLGANGTGTGSGWPVAGENSVVMVDATTGEVLVNLYSASGKKGFVDFETGVIVCQAWSDFEAVYVLAPAAYTTLTGSSWTTGMTFDYNTETDTYSILIQGDRVYFGVARADIEGNAITATDAYGADAVVYTIDGEEVITLASNGNDMVVADGLQGVYANGDDELKLSGCGEATLNDVAGVYEVQEGYVDLYVDGVHYEVVLGEGTYEATVPTVLVTLDADGKATVQNIEANTKVKCALPTLENDDFVFMGWYYADDTQVDADNFVPTEAVTLHAVWQAKVVINFEGVLAGDADHVVIPAGETIGAYLPAYTVDLDNLKQFEGWYLDADFAEALDVDYAVAVEDSGATVYAKWIDLPAYYGTYYGWNTDGKNNNRSSSIKTLTINAEGAISGLRTGTVVSYDAATQKLVWQNAGGTTYISFFNAEAGVFVDNYSSNNNGTIGNDLYTFVKNAETPIDANFALKYKAGAADNGYYTRFIFLHDGRIALIYSDKITLVTLSDSMGNAIESDADLKAASTLVALDAEGEIVLALATTGGNFGTVETYSALDSYFGTYTNAESDDLLIGGNGSFVWGNNSGRYIAVEDGYTLDAYVVQDGVDVGYYQFTLADGTYTVVRPCVTVSFVVPEGMAAIDSVSVNINVPATLPDGEQQGYVFNGYYTDADFANALETTIFTEDTVLYAKYSQPATLTITYNNGADDEDIVYSVGDATDVADPVWAKHKFLGWYTTATFEEDSEWTNGTITADGHIYAKWEDAEAYYNEYGYLLLVSLGYNGYLSKTNYNQAWSIDPDGNATLVGGEAQGLGSAFTIESYDKAAGTFKANVGGSLHAGVIDVETGIMFIDYYSANATLTGNFSAFMFVPDETAAFSAKVTGSANRDSGLMWLTYADGEDSYNYMVRGGALYAGVVFETVDGDTVAAANVATGNVDTYVKKGGVLVAAFGKAGGSVAVELDGLQGTYTKDEGTIVLNGNGGIVINDATAADGEVEGTYVDNGAKLEVYAADETLYLEIVLDGSTYTLTKPTVTITFDQNGFNAAEEFAADDTVNINVAYTLPVYTSDTQVFYGWYLAGDEEQTIVTEIVPSADATYVVKWVQKVTLTVVYGNGLDNATIAYGAGETTAPVQPVLTNGKVFDHWYTSVDGGETEDAVYTASVINADTTIYAAWLVFPVEVKLGYYTATDEATYSDKVFAFVDNGDGSYTSANAGVGSSYSYMVLLVTEAGTISFHYEGSSEGASWDYLRVYYNTSANTAPGGYDGVSVGGKSTVSGDYSRLVNAGEYIAIVYRKDSGADGGVDAFTISNLGFVAAVDATVAFDANGVEVNEELTSAASAVGATIDLPTLTTDEAYYFDGWYVEGAEDTVYTTTYTVAGAVTLKAKWTAKVTLTIVNGKGLDNTVQEYRAGATTAPVLPGYVEGQIGDHFYLSDDDGATEGEAYTASVINADTTVYVAWVDSDPYVIIPGGKANGSVNTYKFVDNGDGTYTSNNAGVNSNTAYLFIRFYEAGVFTVDYTGSSESGYDGLNLAKNSDAGSSKGAYWVSSNSTTSGTYTVEVEAGDFISIGYYKDSSTAGGEDQYTLSNITFTM